MGGHFANCTAAWTLLLLRCIALLCSVKIVIGEDIELLEEEAGVDSFIDYTKVNVSQDEYTRMMSIYLERLQSTQQPETVPKLITFNSERKSWKRQKNEEIRIYFPVKPSKRDIEVQSAELRLLASPVPYETSVRVKIYQVLSPRRRVFVDQKTVYLSKDGPKWCEFDVTTTLQSWITGSRNLGIIIKCLDCSDRLKPLKAAITTVVLPEPRLRKRSLHGLEGGRTDCENVNANKQQKPRCCRHEMMVNFKSLNLKQIIQPKQYEAGFCKGRCPLNFNYATNHSRIQNMVHRLDKSVTPRACCAPSKLEPLEILRVDRTDPTKLTVEKWDNMKVLECACS